MTTEKRYVQCVRGHGGFLVPGSLYEVCDETEDYYYLLGVQGGWQRNRFVDVTPSPPAPPAPPASQIPTASSAPPAPAPIVAGDVVRLKSGGPTMTVEMIGESGAASLAFFDNN